MWWSSNATAGAFGDAVGFGKFGVGRADGNADVVGRKCNSVHGVVEPD
jgi:hypothetical protein